MTEVNNASTQEATNIITHQREVILFDMIARGLALTHRPFNAVELSRGDLDVSQTPICWVMMEKQCPPEAQQKLVNYIHQGGKLILIGRMCLEDFSHKTCTLLYDAIGIKHMQADAPFVSNSINAFGHQDIPVSFLETYSGEFENVFATSAKGEVVGFMKTLGKGQVMVLGAALTGSTLDDIDIVHQMALKMGRPSLFKLSQWADVRLSRGANGSFLFINNYQDDPVETTIDYGGESLFGGNAVSLPARRGLILPVDWRLNDEVLIHYVTSEIVEITQDGPVLMLKTEPAEFSAELTVRGYRCDPSVTVEKSAEAQRIRVHGQAGVIVLKREAANV